MGINISDTVYDIETFEEKCSRQDLETLCSELGVKYNDVRKLKSQKKAV